MSLGLRRTAVDSILIDGSFSDTFALSVSLFLANLSDYQKQESQHNDKINLARTNKKHAVSCRPGMPLKCRRRLS